MHAIRSRARHHGILERRRRHAALQDSYKDGHRSLQVAPDRTCVHPSIPIADATCSSLHACWVCSDGVDSSNQEVDLQSSRQAAFLLVETQEVQAKDRPVIRGSRVIHEAIKRHALQRQAFQGMGPQTVLSGSRADPFETFPIKGQPYAHILLDHCKSFLFVLLRLGKFPDRQVANLLVGYS